MRRRERLKSAAEPKNTRAILVIRQSRPGKWDQVLLIGGADAFSRSIVRRQACDRRGGRRWSILRDVDPRFRERNPTRLTMKSPSGMHDYYLRQIRPNRMPSWASAWQGTCAASGAFEPRVKAYIGFLDASRCRDRIVLSDLQPLSGRSAESRTSAREQQGVHHGGHRAEYQMPDLITLAEPKSV